MAPTLHTLRANPGTVHWGYLDSSLPDVLEICSGDVVRVETVSGGASRLPRDRKLYPVLPEHLEIIERCSPELGPHILTGPINIRGAEPGDVLKVRIDSVELRQNWGWNEIAPGTGLLPELEEPAETELVPIDLDRRRVTLLPGSHVPAAPFFGVLAVKPHRTLGRVTSLVPGVFGGNMDVRHLAVGAEVYFPVFNHGAGFSVGDGHAIQGDGEIDGSAVETALAGTFQMSLERWPEPPGSPFAQVGGELIFIAVHEDLDCALVAAVQNAVSTLANRLNISRRAAYRYCSARGNAAVSQAVNIRKGIHFSVPLPQSTGTANDR